MNLTATPSPCHPLDIRRDIALVPREISDAFWRVLEGKDPWPLLFTGPAGTGKTCAALCILDMSVRPRKFITAKILCDELQACRMREHRYDKRESEWWAEWKACECACVDDIGAREKISDHQYETLKNAIDTRQNLPLILTTNLSLDAIARLYDDRIASRMAGGTEIHYAGQDRRLLPREDGK